MAVRMGSFAIAFSIACSVVACSGTSVSRVVDYDTATSTVAKLVAAVAAQDQGRVNQLTSHPDAPRHARASPDFVSVAASSSLANPYMDEPSGAIDDMANLRNYFEAVGKLEAYEWDADAEALSIKFACMPSDGPRCINRLYFTFQQEFGESARVDMMIGVRNNPAWAQLWAGLPNSRNLAPAAPSPSIETAFAPFQ